jgi:valyl-tRNA synthetase
VNLAQVARSRGHLRFFIMEFPTRFDPKEAEDRIYGMWSDGGYFRADPNSSKPPFTIVIPPPNVTGSLHMGHALNTTLQDILIRSKRMQGYEALYLPGTDHAGIATQTVVEKKLKKEGKRRQEMGREAFLEKGIRQPNSLSASSAWM